MVYPDITASHLVGVETPAVLFPFFDYFANILVVFSEAGFAALLGIVRG